MEVVAGGGDDVVRLSGYYNYADGGAGNDLLVAGSDYYGTSDQLYGGEGNDTVRSAGGYDYLGGGPGNDLVDGRNPGPFYSQYLSAGGDAGNDTVYGGPGDDLVLGGDGDDVVRGGAGNDTIAGDTVWWMEWFGEPVARGADVIEAGPGDDSVFADPADPAVRAGDGFDYLLLRFVSGTAVAHPNRVVVNGQPFPLNSVESLDLHGSDLADVLDLSRFPGPTAATGFAGNDRLTAGDFTAHCTGPRGTTPLSAAAGWTRCTPGPATTR